MAAYKNLLFDVENNVATISFNRPRSLNALNSETVSELFDAVTFCKKEPDIKAVILTGSGEKAFVAGADISELKDKKPLEALAFAEFGHETMRLLETLSKPTVAAVNGLALGGGTEISLACDIRFASENARFGLPEILLGIIPGWGGTQRLSRIIGMGRAKELIMGGEQIDAMRAYEIGLVNRVCQAGRLMDETRKFAERLAGMPAFAIKMAKHSINFGYDLSLDNANRLEMECLAQCFSTDDQKEGARAFLEKRKANFTGH